MYVTYVPEGVAGVNELMGTALKSSLETHLSVNSPMKKTIQI